MMRLRAAAFIFLLVAGVLSVGADLLSWHDAETQFRNHAGERPSFMFPLGTDELGRDRWSRLLHATRLSLLLAPAAAAGALAIGLIVGLVAGWFGGWTDEFAGSITDLVLSLPWLFVLLTLRAVMPLNISAGASLAVTFVLLACTGWAPGARVTRAAVARLRDGRSVQHARACGCGQARLLLVHVLPNLRPILAAQFWILLPAFLLAEANLGMLGLGVSEPIPSWGNMLAELRYYDRIPEAPWILAPAIMLVLVVASVHTLLSESRQWE
jgi:peptide/nickel transport system permease protein